MHLERNLTFMWNNRQISAFITDKNITYFIFCTAVALYYYSWWRTPTHTWRSCGKCTKLKVPENAALILESCSFVHIVRLTALASADVLIDKLLLHPNNTHINDNSQSVCLPVCVPPMTFEVIGRFLWNLVDKWCHWRGLGCNNL